MHLKTEDLRIGAVLLSLMGDRDALGLEVVRLMSTNDGRSKKMAEKLKGTMQHLGDAAISILESIAGVNNLTIRDVHAFLAVSQQANVEAYDQIYRAPGKGPSEAVNN